MDNDEYTWDGQWQNPGMGSYVINKNDCEMEPGEVVETLASVSDLFQQNEALQERIAELEADKAALGVEATHTRIALKNAVKDLNRVDPSIKRYEGTYLTPLET